MNDALLRTCISLRTEQAGHHKASVPYAVFQAVPVDNISLCRANNLPWRAQLSLRSWCRVRAGLVYLSSVNGRPSRPDRPSARQRCIFCNIGIRRNATVHALGICKNFDALRNAFILCHSLEGCSADAACTALLRTSPGVDGFMECLALFDAIDVAASRHWNSRDPATPP